MRRLVDDRELAGSKRAGSTACGGTAATTTVAGAGRPLPDAGRAPRRGPRDRLDQGDQGGHAAAARPRWSPRSPSVIAPGEPGQRPEVRLRYRGPPQPGARCSACSAPATARRALVLRFRGKGRSAVWDGRLREGRSRREGDYAFTVQVRDRAGNGPPSPAEVPTRARRPARNGRVGPAVHAPRPAVGGARRRPWRACEVGPFDRSFEFVLSRLGTPRPVERGERIGGRFRVRVPRGRAHRRLPGPRPGRGPPRRLAAGRGGPAADAGSAAPLAAARGAAGAHLAGAEPGGRRPRRLRGHLPAARRVRLDREFAGGALPAGLRSERLAAAALPRPRGARLRPDHRPLAGPRRGPGARQRPRRGVRGQRGVDCRRRSEGGCAATWRAAAGWRPSARTRSAAASGSTATCSADPRRPAGERLRRAHGAAAHRRGAAQRVRRTSSGCSTASAA